MNNKSYLLVGGYAAAHAAKAIRERDPQSEVLLVNAEDHLPYERPPLSKDALFDTATSPLQTEVFSRHWYNKNKVDLLLDTRVTQIDREMQTATLSSGEVIKYDHLLLATGASAKRPSFEGANFPNVFLIRTWKDIETLRSALHVGKRAVIIGGSYLGLEVASGCVKLGIETTVVDSHAGPWSKFASPDLQAFIRNEYEKTGVKFEFNQKIDTINGQGRAQSVQIESRQLPCDFVVAATGATLNTDLAKDCGLEVDPKNGIVVDENLRSSDKNIFVAGDCACFFDPSVGRRWHVEHYQNARWQGEIAGANMTGDTQAFNRAPYFFSDFLDLHMVLRGDPQGGKNTKIIGEMTSGEFIQLYANDEKIVKMALVITHDKAKSEQIAIELEPLVRADRSLDSFQKSDFGAFFGG